MARRSGSEVGRWLVRAGWWGGGLLLAAFALEGGEYGTLDVLARRERVAELAADSARRAAIVDSLTRAVELVRDDDATIERIAREEYGLVASEREIVFRFLDVAEDSAAAPDSASPR